MFRLILLLIASAALAQPPAGNEPARVTESGGILPGGRRIAPLGRQFVTGPGPFGIAISSDGHIVATANGGPNRYSLAILENDAVREIAASGRRRGARDRDDDESAAPWQSVFMGIAFDGPRVLYVSEGDSGRVRRVDSATGKHSRAIALNQGSWRDSYTGDMAFDRARHLLYVVDQANFRLAIVDAHRRRVLASIGTGRLPFSAALSPDAKTAYVTNLGMFEYHAIPGADPQHTRETGLPFPAFGFPSPEAANGARRATGKGMIDVPGLGDPNVAAANSLAVIDVSRPKAPRLVAQIPTGIPFGAASLGGASPSGVAATADAVFVSNANQDSISVIDARTLRRAPDIPLRIKGYESLRGVLPVGLAVTPDGGRLLVAEAGINALAVIDTGSRQVLGDIPTAWFPAAVSVLGDTVYVANAKGNGTGPNAGVKGDVRRGSISRFPLPAAADLPALTAQVVANNGFDKPAALPEPPPVSHVVIIVKENRTYDEVFGDLPPAANGPRAGLASLARWGIKVTPNHHALAGRFATSDNFYADSEVSVDGHHWLVGSYPNAWTVSSLDAAYGGEKHFRLPTSAPGRLLFAGSSSSLHPEEQLQAGALWHHLERNHIPFLNFGEGFELAGIDESQAFEPTGGRFLTNIPMPEPLYRNTVRTYPGFNMNIPDQFRADAFIREMTARFGDGKAPLPGLIFIHLPNDHTARVRPQAGYPKEASYVADNDLALGRILDYLSHSPWWAHMAVLITEDDAQSGVDHVDSHRTVLLIAGPYVRRNYVSHVNSSFPGLLKTAFWLLRLPPLNLYDVTAAALSDCFTSEPDLSPYQVLPVDPAIFNPAKARPVPGEPPGPAMDDPAEIQRQRRELGR